MRTVLYSILIITAVACSGNSEVPQELTDLQNRVAHADSLSQELDSATIWGTFNKVKPYYLYLSSTDFDSSLAEVYIRDLTWLDRYQRALGKWRNKTRIHEVQLEESMVRLQQLQHDIEYNLLDPETASTYIGQEELVVRAMLKEITERGGEILYYAEGADSMQTRLSEIFPEL